MKLDIWINYKFCTLNYVSRWIIAFVTEFSQISGEGLLAMDQVHFNNKARFCNWKFDTIGFFHQCYFFKISISKSAILECLILRLQKQYQKLLQFLPTGSFLSLIDSNQPIWDLILTRSEFRNFLNFCFKKHCSRQSLKCNQYAMKSYRMRGGVFKLGTHFTCIAKS